MKKCERIIQSPVGPLRMIAQDDCIVGLYFPDQPHAPKPDLEAEGTSAVLDLAGEQLSAFFEGKRQHFSVPYALTGTPFQKEVWQQLIEIPYGSQWTYGELAKAVGRPKAVRAVGAANGRNPLSIIIPCHRVVGANGSLTGYAGGVERKRWLLMHESGSIPPTFADDEQLVKALSVRDQLSFFR